MILSNFTNLNCFVLGQAILSPVLILKNAELVENVLTFLTIVDVRCSVYSSTFYFTLLYWIYDKKFIDIRECSVYAHYAVDPLYRGTVSSVMTGSTERI